MKKAVCIFILMSSVLFFSSCEKEEEEVYGCTDIIACNYNPEVNMADGSCEYADEEYDCEGNEITFQVGDLDHGGIVFYVDETGQHGLVAALEDLGSFEWGCFGFTGVSGSDGQTIGAGFQNTLEIEAGCLERPIAASEALAYEIEGYDDWYLPSKDELVEMYKAIGKGSPEGNLGGFDTFDDPFYWSSSEEQNVDEDYIGAWGIYFDDGYQDVDDKDDPHLVRVIRAF